MRPTFSSSVTALLFILLGGVNTSAVTLGFSDAEYKVRQGSSVTLVTSFDESISNGLEGYALRLVFPSGILTLSGSDIVVPAELDFDLFDPKAERTLGSDFAAVAGYVEFGQPAYAGTEFASFTITIPIFAPIGTYTLELVPLLSVGTNFVDGVGNDIDEAIVFGSTVLEILPFRTPEFIEDLIIESVGPDILLSFTGVPGEPYWILASPDLTADAWTILTEIVAPESGVIEYTDAGASSLDRRFYSVGGY